ncbi:UDP-3-O-(3-hydroxymyristoyl)glucosamine N-acyltransferase [Paludibacterium yongneupense]|uniref:UDP-3-O-(3-hydroxymyristoyl)glucosamine N-acyltransferase n=1 Tax=Paludibacterium yongneupense TaxID=400061 RepID=UPI000419E510|nr:UDP-3-O-(3-hydroxymyristoyl)glucosamine N-acyltransferase [Paludibacterium yongneupense]
MSYFLSEIVARLGGEVRGDDVAVERLAPLESAQAGEISFLASAKYRRQLDATRAGALIVSPQLAEELSGRFPLIVVADPYLYFARVATLFHPSARANGSVHPSAVLGAASRVPASCQIGAHVVIGDGTVLGERCLIHPGVVIGDGVEIGDDTTIYPNVTVYGGCRIGQRVTLHSGCVIGADGFGLAWDRDHWFKIPQTGRAIIGDDVEIGANTTVDRGAMADTIVENGAKIDNLVQIAHNVQIGEHSAIAGCVGIAGSTRIGAYCTVGGAAMFVGHIEVADRSHIGGGTLVSKSIRKPDNYASSYPLQTMKDWLANAVHVRHLDDLVKRVKCLEREIETLKYPKDDQNE